MLPASKADIVLLQKTKVVGGWSLALGEACKTDNGYPSAGCGVVASRDIGLSPLGVCETDHQHRTRFAGACANAVVKGGVHVFSIYLKDSVGLNDYNLDVLKELAAELNATQTPRIRW